MHDASEGIPGSDGSVVSVRKILKALKEFESHPLRQPGLIYNQYQLAARVAGGQWRLESGIRTVGS
jgi:hypothetical protein